MKAICPNNSNHQEFLAGATVRQEWKIDSSGNFLEETNTCSDIIDKPDLGIGWTCFTCGADAKRG